MSSTINLSFYHQAEGRHDLVNATIIKHNGVLYFKSILLSAEDGKLDDPQATEQEAIRQHITNKAGAVDFLKSRNFLYA